jgi:carboxypeptidase family protein
MRKIPSIVLIFLVTVSVIAQTGGGFDLQQNVIGNGGWRSDGGGFTVLGTMGQSNAGSTTVGGGFHIIDGLWAIENLTPSSPFANVGGQVTRAKGIGIAHVMVTISNSGTGLNMQTFTGAHGDYQFGNIPTGQNYLVTVSHPHFTFETGSVEVFISQDRAGVDFVSKQ